MTGESVMPGRRDANVAQTWNKHGKLKRNARAAELFDYGDPEDSMNCGFEGVDGWKSVCFQRELCLGVECARQVNREECGALLLVLKPT